jgi:hypothetical protein
MKNELKISNINCEAFLGIFSQHFYIQGGGNIAKKTYAISRFFTEILLVPISPNVPILPISPNLPISPMRFMSQITF